MSITQREFNQFVRNFNDNYLEVLGRAAAGRSDERLVQSFLWLNETYEVVLRLHDLGDVGYEVLMLPLSFRGNEEFLREHGFDEIQIERILKFLVYFRERTGPDLEAATPGAVAPGAGENLF
jgi:hypothetical protein